MTFPPQKRASQSSAGVPWMALPLGSSSPRQPRMRVQPFSDVPDTRMDGHFAPSLSGRLYTPDAALRAVVQPFQGGQPGAVASRSVKELMSLGAGPGRKVGPMFGPVGTCQHTPVSVDPEDITDLSGMCTISLGINPDFGDLAASVWPGYSPSLGAADQMLSAYLPDWYTVIGSLSSNVWRSADQILTVTGLPTGSLAGLSSPAGLFFDDSRFGFFYYAMRYALVTLYAFSSSIDATFGTSCGLTAQKLREVIEIPAGQWIKIPEFVVLKLANARNMNITIDSNFRCTGSRAITFPALAMNVPFTNPLHVAFGSCYEMEAALADYYFWWANRLWNYAIGLEKGDPDRYWTYWIGMLCARCGLSEIIELAATLLHEISHFAGGNGLARYWECAVGQTRLDCCRFGLEYMFRNRMWASLALPPGLMVSGATSSSRMEGRYNNRSWSSSLQGVGAGGSGPDCTSFNVRAQHSSILFPHPVSGTIAIPNGCASGSQSISF